MSLLLYANISKGSVSYLRHLFIKSESCAETISPLPLTEILQAHLSSPEETIFGNYLEDLAIFICSKVYDGFKSSTAGIDLEMEKDGKHYIVAIKSGPNWANSDQIVQLAEDLLAYFYAQHLDSPCGSVVFAYHNQSKANDVYTAGRINFDAIDSSGMTNVDPNATDLKYTLTLNIGGALANQEYVVTY